MGILLYTPLTVEFYQRERGARAGDSIFFEFKQKLNDKKKMAPAIKGEKKNDQVRREAPLYLAIICYWEERDSWAKHFKSLARIRGEIETKMQHQRSTNTNYRFLSYREKHTHTVRAASFSPFLKSRETRYMVAQKTKQKLSLRLSTEEMATFLFFFSLLNS